MNRDRLAAEPTVTVADASPAFADALARELALRAARQLLDGQADWADEDQWRRDGLSASPSPAVRHVATTLPGLWSRRNVATAVCAWFELFGGADRLRHELGQVQPNGQDARDAA